MENLGFKRETGVGALRIGSHRGGVGIGFWEEVELSEWGCKQSKHEPSAGPNA